MCGTSLVAQWLRPCAPDAGGLGSIPVQGTGSHMPQLGVHPQQLKMPYATTKIEDSARLSWRVSGRWAGRCRAAKTRYSQINFFFFIAICQSGWDGMRNMRKNSGTITLHADRISTSEKLQYCSNIPRSWDDASNYIQESKFKCWILYLLMASKEGSWAEVKVLNQERTQCDTCNKECLTSWVYTLVRES